MNEIKKLLWMAATWIAHGLAQYGLIQAFGIVAGMIALPLWVLREIKQDGINTFDDYMDLVGPFGVSLAGLMGWL